jgi:hypothetical protein
VDIGKRNDDEGAKEKLFTYASYVPVVSFKVCRSHYYTYTPIDICVCVRVFKPPLSSKCCSPFGEGRVCLVHSLYHARMHMHLG